MGVAVGDRVDGTVAPDAPANAAAGAISLPWKRAMALTASQSGRELFTKRTHLVGMLIGSRGAQLILRSTSPGQPGP